MRNACAPRCTKFIILAIVGVAALAVLVMLLWNWLIPTLFVEGKQINYLQALGVLVLSKILFGSFRGHGCHGRMKHQCCGPMTKGDGGSCGSGSSSCCGEAAKQEASAE